MLTYVLCVIMPSHMLMTTCSLLLVCTKVTAQCQQTGHCSLSSSLTPHPLHFFPCPTPFNPLLISSLADLVCETAGKLVDGTGFYDSRESGASADLVAWLAGTEWGPQQHKKAGVSEGREVGE